MQRFTLTVGEPWDFQSSDGSSRVDVELVGAVEGPTQIHWAKSYLLLRVITPFEIDGQLVKLMVAAPRYVTERIESISSHGGTVGVARVLPGISIDSQQSFQASDVQYCMIGILLPEA